MKKTNSDQKIFDFEGKNARAVHGKTWTKGNPALCTDMSEAEKINVMTWMLAVLLLVLADRGYTSRLLPEQDAGVYVTRNPFKDALPLSGCCDPVSEHRHNRRSCINERSPANRNAAYNVPSLRLTNKQEPLSWSRIICSVAARFRKGK